MQPEIRSLPVRVRPTRFETLTSFKERLAFANGIPTVGLVDSWLRAHSSVDSTKIPSPELLERAAQLAPGFFGNTGSFLPAHSDGSTCENCTTGLARRFGCTRCSGGATVAEELHDGPRVCKRHQRWIGPAAAPDEQFQVDIRVLRADRKYRQLRRRGLLDAHRLAELLGCVELWANAECSAKLSAADRFVIAIGVATTILPPRAIHRLLDTDRAVSTRYAQLHELVQDITKGPCVVLVDAIWLLIRTASYGESADPHAFVCVAPESGLDDRAHLEQVRTCSYPRVKHLHEAQYVGSVHPGSRFDRYEVFAHKNVYVCARGHRFISTPAILRNAKGSDGCGYCAGKRAMPGFNSLADTHPELATQWHPTLNGDVGPEDLIAGSDRLVAFQCENGHTTWQRVHVRTRGSGCSVCSNRAVDPAVNSLAALRPDVAAVWHPTMNAPLQADQVTPTTERAAWWQCHEKAHAYRMSIARRVKGGTCGVCKRRYADKTTSLAATHPALAKRWHPTKNGRLRPEDVLSGSGQKVWFRCDRGHSFRSTVMQQSRNAGCGVCANKLVTADNCLRRTHPHLAEELHPSKNGEVTAESITAGSGLHAWWVCRLHGHEWSAPVRNRARGAQCPVCSNRTVLQGFNDLATTRPDLVALWSTEANGDLKPTAVVAGTNKLIAWGCERGHRWRATGQSQSRRTGCSQCAQHREQD